MALNLRCRGPSGQVTLPGLDPDMTVLQFLELLQQQTGVPPSSAELLAGFPPKQLLLPTDPSSSQLRDLGLVTGDTFTLRMAPAPAAPAPAPAEGPPAAGPAAVQAAQAPPAPAAAAAVHQGMAAVLPAPAPAPAPASAPAGYLPSHEDEDEDLARALAASLADAHTGPQPPVPPAPAASTSTGLGQQQAAERSVQGEAAAVSIPLGDGSYIARRIIDSDNSCLFNAVGYVMEHTRSKSQELRRVISQAVAADPVTYNEGFLGMENEAYCKWILGVDKWGGAIELSILSRHYAREIAAFDIRTKRCDVYGQGSGFDERVLLIYDGLHYDSLAVAAFESAPEELDMTIFNPESRDGEQIMKGAEKLVDSAHNARQFTDTANFTLRCGVCQLGLKGEKEAVEHAKTTGHSNFSEY